MAILESSRTGTAKGETGTTRLRVSQGLLIGLALLLALNAVLGPLLTGTIRYRFSASMLAQTIGLDAVTLVVVAPIAVAAAVLTGWNPRAGLVIGLAPATFSAYMAPQYIVGPDYLHLPGNNERYFVLHLAILITAIATCVVLWSALAGAELPPDGPASRHRRAWIMAGVVAFIAMARWLPAVVALTAGADPGTDFRDNPTAYLLIGVLDLGLVVPAATAAGIGLLRDARWASRAAYGVIMWFALVPLSVAAMAITMLIRDVPAVSHLMAAVFSVAALVFVVGAVLLVRPLFASPARRPL